MNNIEGRSHDPSTNHVPASTVDTTEQAEGGNEAVWQPPGLARQATGELAADDKELQELIYNNEELKVLFNQVNAHYGKSDPQVTFSMISVLLALIELSDALRGAASAIAERLQKVTEKLNAYSKLMTGVPVVLKDQLKFDSSDPKIDSDFRANANQYLANILEAVRANKGIEEDKAKKIQTILQTMKDAGTSISDFLGAFISLLQSIATKINQ